VGAAVNIECDILAKYVERLVESRRQSPISRLTVARLLEEGFGT
jgi:riboflavin synthase alpha subunit